MSAVRVPASSDEVIATIQSQSEALRALGVRRLVLFGSFPRGEATQDSDVDLLVEFDQASFRAWVGAKRLLEGALGRKVDLVTSAAVRPHLWETIREDSVEIPGFPAVS